MKTKIIFTKEELISRYGISEMVAEETARLYANDTRVRTPKHNYIYFAVAYEEFKKFLRANSSKINYMRDTDIKCKVIRQWKEKHSDIFDDKDDTSLSFMVGILLAMIRDKKIFALTRPGVELYNIIVPKDRELDEINKTYRPNAINALNWYTKNGHHS